MRWQRVILMWCAVAPLAAAAEDDAAVVELREAVRAWIGVEDRISEERADWQVEKDRMGRLLGLYREELALLDEELEQAGHSAGGHDERMAKVREDLARLRVAQLTATETVAAAVPRLRQLAGQFPEPLRAEAADDLATLREWKPGDAPREGLRALLGVMGRADAFHHRLTRTHEVREGREVEVLYLGLARAYFVGGGKAGVGVPGNGGWVWREEPALAGELGKVLAMLEQKRTPAVVSLPVRVGSDALGSPASPKPVKDELRSGEKGGAR